MSNKIDNFDAGYYALANPEVVKAYGNSEDALYDHYINYGKSEGRSASRPTQIYDNFDANYYAQNNPDVVGVFGNSADALYNHYLTYGKKEGRLASAPTQELAQNYASGIKEQANADTQALVNQYKTIADNQKQALAQQKQLTLNQINAQRDDVEKAYHNNARQAYINSMLGRKQLEQQLSQAGLNTSGLVASAYSDLANGYGNALASLQNQRDTSINNINRQLNDAEINYAMQQNKLLADIGNAEMDLQKYGNELAYRKYQDAISNYMTFANYDYNRNRDSVSDRQFQQQYDLNKTLSDRDFAYQQQRDAVADDQWLKEYELALKKANSSGKSSSGGGYSGYSIDNYTIPEDGNTDDNSDAYYKYKDMIDELFETPSYKNNNDNYKEKLKTFIANKIRNAVTNNEISYTTGGKLYDYLNS